MGNKSLACHKLVVIVCLQLLLMDNRVPDPPANNYAFHKNFIYNVILIIVFDNLQM